jgi:hypothetical protein
MDRPCQTMVAWHLSLCRRAERPFLGEHILIPQDEVYRTVAMRICAIVAGLAFAGCSSAAAPDSAVQIRPVLQDGEVFTDFGWVTLLNNCGKRVTFVGITAPPTDSRSPGSLSYQLRPTNGELITVEVGSCAKKAAPNLMESGGNYADARRVGRWRDRDRRVSQGRD